VAARRVVTGPYLAQGPLWFGDQRVLLFGDLAHDRLMRYDSLTCAVAVYAEGCGAARPATRDAHGRMLVAERSGRRVTRTEHDGTVVVLADRRPDGERLAGPTDVAVRWDGSVWFTDCRGDSAVGALYRIDGRTGTLLGVETGLREPASLCLSADGTRLYVVDDASVAPSVNLFYVDDLAVGHGGVPVALEDARVVLDLAAAGTGGLRCDASGLLWLAAGSDGVVVVTPGGYVVGRVSMPEPVTDLGFGPAGQVFVTAGPSVYLVEHDDVVACR
jgi:gluconolactonase